MFESIPSELKEWPNWILWRLEDKGQKKPSKVPYRVNGRMAKVDKADTWTTFEEVMDVYNTGGYAGIGFVFTSTPFVGIDIDSCYDLLKGFTKEAEEAINTLDSYTEFSQSHTGVHIIAKGKLPDGSRRKNGFEIYGDGSPRYFAMTGTVCSSKNVINERQEEINWFHRKYIQGKDFVQEIVDRAIASKHGEEFKKLWEGDISKYNEDDSKADLALCNYLAFWTNKNPLAIDRLFRASGLYRPKWDEKRGQNTYGQITINKAIAECENTYNSNNIVDFPVKTEVWGDLMPITVAKAPRFPVECLPTVLSDYCSEVAESIQVPIDMPAIAALVVTASCIQKNYKIQGKSEWVETLNLYSLIIASPAERKSAVMNVMTKFVRDFEMETNTTLRPRINESRLKRETLESSIQSLRNKASKGNDDSNILLSLMLEKQNELDNLIEVKPLRLIADDASPEALTSLLAENGGSMSVISSEGGIFDIMSGRYSNTVNIQTFLQAHGGEDIYVDRKNRPPEHIKCPVLSVLLAIQPSVLDGVMKNEAFMGRGLTARFLYCIPESLIGNRSFDTKAVSADAQDTYKDLIFSLLSSRNSDSFKMIRLSNEAYSLISEFHREIESRLCTDLIEIQGWAGKLHGTILRFAGILHCVKERGFAHDKQVSPETMRSAITMGRYFLEHAKIAFGIMESSSTVQNAFYVLSKIRSKLFYKFTLRELQRNCRKFKTSEDMYPVLDMLTTFGYIRSVQAPSYTGIGRPINDYWETNPRVFEADVNEDLTNKDIEDLYRDIL